MTAVPLFGLSVVLLLTGCSQCENDQLSEAPSPSGKLKAIAFSRNCGATTGFNVQVSVVPKESKIGNDSGNALVADGAKLQFLSWDGEARVTVGFSGNPRLFKNVAVQGVTVVTAVPGRSNNSLERSRDQ